MSKRTSSGFTVVEVVLLLVIAGLIGVVGYKVYNTNSSVDKLSKSTSSESKALAPSENLVPAKINSSSDLEQAERALDSFGSSSADNQDLSKLDSELSAF